MEWAIKKHLIFTSVGILILLISFLLIVLLLPAKNNHLPSDQMASIKKTKHCPKDYCGNWILGSCAGKKERYRERECYDYPEGILTLSECEASKRIYYEKGAQADETC